MKSHIYRVMLGIRILLTIFCVSYVGYEWGGILRHQPVHVLVVLQATLAAAALIWLPNPTVRGWTWLAFLVLGFGSTLVLFAHSRWSMLAIGLMVAASIGLWRLHRRQFTTRIIVTGTDIHVPLAMKIKRTRGNVEREQERALDVSSGQDAWEAPVAALRPEPPAIRREQVVRVVNPSQPAPMQSAIAYDFSENVRRARHTFDAVVGMDETKRRLLRAARDILECNARPRNGVLLFGAPGNGKTFFAEGLAGELEVPFLSIAYGDTASKWVNETPQKVKAVFAEARRIGACVLFIDEIDSFIKSRDGREHAMDRDLTNVMLTETVALRGTQVILVAATNLFDALDGAGIRDGRFDYKIEVPAPDLKARVALLERSVCEELGDEFVESMTIMSLAKRWDGFSAARLSLVGAQLRDLHRDGCFQGPVTVEIGMRAMRLLQGRKGALPENVKDIADIVMPEASRGVLGDLAFKMTRTESLERLGATLPTGVIFAGPPGTGKTQAAMALAKASGWAFLPITGAQIMADPRSWDRTWREACDIRPTIIFIDEADGILQDRRFSGNGVLTERILTTMDGAGGQVRDVVFIAATNHADRIDAAALRSRRFEERVDFDIPGVAVMADYVRNAFLRRLGNRWKIRPGVVEQLIDVLRGRTIADAEAVIERAIGIAALRRIRERTADIRTEDVVRGARDIIAS